MGSFKDLMEFAEQKGFLEARGTGVQPDITEKTMPGLIRLSDVEPEEVSWLWPGYIPRGKVTLLCGDPGLGKSWATLDLAARLTVGGETPDRNHRMEKGTVLLLTAEDGVADTVRRRFDAQGGDASQVLVLESIVDQDGNARLPSLVDNIPELEQTVRSTEAQLFVVDPLNAYTGKINSHVDADVRRALTPLAKMAERTGAAVVVVMHLNKAALQPVLYRVQGTIGYVAAARSVIFVVRDKDDPTRRVLAPVKSNLGAEMPPLGFTITQEPALAWEGVVQVNVSELLAPASQERDEQAMALVIAGDFLCDVLADGEVDAKEVFEGADAAGISKRTLQRAKAQRGIRVTAEYQEGKKGVSRWVWALPDEIGRHHPHGYVGGLNAESYDRPEDIDRHLNPEDDYERF